MCPPRSLILRYRSLILLLQITHFMHQLQITYITILAKLHEHSLVHKAPAMSNRTSCAQVHELLQSYCRNNRDIYMCIYMCIYIYIHTYIYIYILIQIKYTVILKTSLSQFNNFTCLQSLFTSRTFYCYNLLYFYYIRKLVIIE